MASGEAAAAAAAPDAVKSQVTVLKVSIHCEGCKKKVFRILRKIEGIELLDIDARQNKVTVKAPVDAQTLIGKFKKSGKHAELWPVQNIITPAEHTADAKKEIKEPPKSEEKKENTQNPAIAAAASKTEAKEPKTEAAKGGENSTSKEPKKKADDVSVESAKPPTEPAAAPAAATDQAEKIKAPADSEKTVKKGLIDGNSHPVLEPQPAYIMSYNTAQPSVVQSHYFSPAPMPVSQGYMYGDQYAPWAAAPPPEYSYNYNYSYNADDGHSAAPGQHQPAAYGYGNSMFSDEDPNGCSVM